MLFRLLSISLLSICLFASCAPQTSQQSDAAPSKEELSTATPNLPLHKIKLPPGFSIEIFAEVENARSLAKGDRGTIFVGNRSEDKVYALRDTDGDRKADQKYVIAEGLNSPNGVAFKDGDLYVAEISRILKFPAIEAQLARPPKPEVVFDDLPNARHHGWKFIAFGPDGMLYVPVGAPCNICESKKEVFASINRMYTDGTGFEVYAHGVRNTVGFDWHPDTKELWFTDNGRDWMGDDMPPCEINRVTAKGQHFGYPYCHGGNIPDPDYDERGCDEFVAPALNLGAHVAPLGARFYRGKMFPPSYQKQLIFAEHGSWNREKKAGYKLAIARPNQSGGATYEVFAEGWLDHTSQAAWGRPVDVLEMSDGSLLVSDDYADVVYRISYSSD